MKAKYKLKVEDEYADCPECDYPEGISLYGIMENEVVACLDCGAEFEFLGKEDKYALFSTVEKVEEDWGE